MVELNGTEQRPPRLTPNVVRGLWVLLEFLSYTVEDLSETQDPDAGDVAAAVVYLGRLVKSAEVQS